MRRALAILLLVAASGLTPGDARAVEGATPVLALTPANATLPQDGGAGPVLLLHNPLARPVTLALSNDTAPFLIAYETPQVTLAPNASVKVRSSFHVPGTVPPGNYVVNVTAVEVAANGTAARLRAQAPFAVKVVAKSVPTRAAAAGVTLRVEPAEVNLTSGGEAVVRLLVANGGATAWTPAFRVQTEDRLTAEPAFPPAPVAGGHAEEIALVLRDAGGAAPGDSNAYVIPADPAVSPVAFRVHLAQAPAAAAAAAPAAAAGAGSSLAAPALVAGGVAATGGVAAAALLLRRRWPFFAAALYTRLKPNRVLDQPTRERIAQIVGAEPGIAFSDLARRLDLGFGALTYHAQVLERSGVVFSARDGQQRRFFPVAGGFVKGSGSLSERALQALLSGPRGLAELARELGVSRQALHYHLKRLAEEGRVVARGNGRAVRFERA